MVALPPPDPLPEEGLTRKLLGTLRARFMLLNQTRLQRTLQGMSARQQRVLRLLPLLLHVNHPMLPGYVSAATPAGLAGFEPDAGQLGEAQCLSRSFVYKPARGAGAPCILGLFLMGSLGTVAQDEHSDLDVWVCHAPSLDDAQREELRRKCDQLRSWAASQGSEAHFFLVDPQRFAQGRRDTQLTSDDCGTTQHYLLLDEFYRTAIWLGGQTPLWWLVPASHEHRYDEYVAMLFERCLVRSEEALDLGHLGRIPPGEFLGAGLWQLYKAIEAPYKSLFKLLLVQCYASQHPRLRCLALDFKQAVHHGTLDVEALDPYIAAYHAIADYLHRHGDRERLELARRCLYLKINRPLSRPPRNRHKSWQRCLLERMVRAWQWDERQLRLLDNRSRWKVRQVSRERRALVNELSCAYRFLEEFSRRQEAASPLDSRDLLLLGRRLYAAIDRRAGKVEALNLGIAADLAEDSLTLVHACDASGVDYWSLHQGSLNAQQQAEVVPLKRARQLAPLLAWSHLNGVLDAASRVSLFPGDSGLSEAELSALLGDLRRTLPVPFTAPAEADLLADSRPSRVLWLINVGIEPHGALHADPNLPPENLIRSIDQLLLNSWNELLVTRHEGPQALPRCLRELLAGNAGHPGQPQLQAFCFARHRGQAIARRVVELVEDAGQRLAEPQPGRYLLQIRQQLHVLQRSGATLTLSSLRDRAALLEQLGETRQRFSPLWLERRALAGDTLGLILPLGRPDRLQVFYRVIGATAEISVLDEHNSLWQQRQPYRDEPSLLLPLLRFLRALGLRRSLHDALAAQPVIDCQRIVEAADGTLQLQPRPLEAQTLDAPAHDVQAIVEPGEQGRLRITLYCNHREFSALEYGAGLFAAVAGEILAQRRHAERYPCYITDLDLSALHDVGPAQTVQHLRYKARLERALNAALRDA